MISKVLLIFSSLLIVINTFLFTEGNTWPIDLFYYLPVFSLILIIDFIAYELKCPGYKGKDHSIFCTFALSRWDVLKIEVKYYFKRWEILVFVFSILFYISFFYLFENGYPILVFIGLTLYVLQIWYLVTILFLIKNIFSKNIETNVKNIASILITIIILIYSFSGTSPVIEFIFYINPLTCGFMSYLLGAKYAFFSIFIIILLMLCLCLIAYKKFSKWPL
jgi:hypothetical protein